MRILVLNYEFPPLGGGAAPASYEIARQLAESETNNIDVVTMGFRHLPAYEELTPNLRVHRVKSLRGRRDISQPWEQAMYLFSGFMKARQLIEKGRYHKIHCHFIVPTGILALLLKSRFGIPYVISAHGSDVPGYNPDRFVFLHFFTRPLLKLICDEAEKIIALSHYLKDLIRQKISYYDDSKLVVIPNGIDPEKFKPLRKEKIILSTGRLLPRKGFQHLIRAVSPKDFGYEVHIAGDGPMLGELQVLAQDSKTPIIFHGWMDNNNEEYCELLGQASIYCLVSKSENASMALLEAMSAGCAVITSEAPGCVETVAQSGKTIAYGDVGSLAYTLSAFADDPGTQTKYGVTARNRILAHFQWQEVMREYVKIFNA